MNSTTKTFKYGEHEVSLTTGAIARQAEAERMRRAKVIAAEGELQASHKLTEAAGVLSSQPEAITLRYLQTMLDMSHEENQTIFFPLPIELMKAVNRLADNK